MKNENRYIYLHAKILFRWNPRLHAETLSISAEGVILFFSRKDHKSFNEILMKKIFLTF